MRLLKEPSICPSGHLCLLQWYQLQSACFYCACLCGCMYTFTQFHCLFLGLLFPSSSSTGSSPLSFSCSCVFLVGSLVNMLVCVPAKHRGASGLCLLDIGGPCTPMMVWHKDCCLSSHKSSHSFCFALPSPQRPPSFLTLSILAGEWSQGVRWGQSRHVPMPVALGIHSNSTWLVGGMHRLNKRTCVFTAAAWSMLTFYL